MRIGEATENNINQFRALHCSESRLDIWQKRKIDMAHAKEPSFRESVDLMFTRAVVLMDLPPGLEEKIRVCNATYTVRFGVRLRGQIQTFTGYRSVHSEHMEPAKGGIRYSMDVKSGRSRGAGGADDL